MGRKSKRQYINARKIDKNSDGEEDEVFISDSEWDEIQQNIKKQILDDELTWQAIIEYGEFEDDHYFVDYDYQKPSISEFVVMYKNMNREKDNEDNEDNKDNEWITA